MVNGISSGNRLVGTGAKLWPLVGLGPGTKLRGKCLRHMGVGFGSKKWSGHALLACARRPRTAFRSAVKYFTESGALIRPNSS
jgi:hypothetical protein